MQMTFKFFVPFILCLALLVVSGGCGGGNGGDETSKASNKAMTTAANQLVAADTKMKALMDKYPNPSSIPLEDFQQAFSVFKIDVNVISLDSCDEEFKDAFIAWRQSLVAELEFVLAFLGDRRNPNTIAELQKSSHQERYAKTQFKAVCQKLELNIKF